MDEKGEVLTPYKHQQALRLLDSSPTFSPLLDVSLCLPTT